MARRGLLVLGLLAACSSSGGHASPPVVASPSASALQSFVAHVDVLCSTLQSGVEALPGGGSLSVSAADWIAQQPAHAALEAQFDAGVAALVPDPAPAAALKTYVTFASAVDARRLAAAHRGDAAFSAEVKSESGFAEDPAVKGLLAAGFSTDCEAR